MNANEIRRKNEKFLFERKQKLEELEESCPKTYDISNYYLFKLIKENTWEPLAFKFGKYKDVLVDVVLEEDKNYIVWFQNNVQGRDLETLRIKDYLSFKLRNEEYYLDNIYSVAKRVLAKLYPDKSISISEYINYNTDKSYSNSSSTSSSFISGYNDTYDDYADDYYDCFDYGDLC